MFLAPRIIKCNKNIKGQQNCVALIETAASGVVGFHQEEYTFRISPRSGRNPGLGLHKALANGVTD
jgi:hypothetical protein